MPECKLFEDCTLFNKADFLSAQEILNRSKEEFCNNNFKQCARYQIVKALGREQVPELLLPPQAEIAKQLIEKTDQQRIKDEKEKYKKIFEAAPMGIMIEDKTGTILEANKALCEITGYNKEELEGNKVLDTLVPSELEKEAAKNISQVMAGEDLEMLIKSDTKDGNTAYIKICETKVTLPAYEEAIISMQTDITNRKELETELKEKQEILNKKLEYHQKYEKLFNNINSGVAVYRAVDKGSNFVFVDINKKGQEMDGIDRKEVLNKSVTEVFPAVKEFGLLAVLKRVYKTGEPEEHPIKKYEDDWMTAYRKNYVYKLSTDEVVAVYDDVTDKKRQEIKLKEVKNRLELAIEGANLGLWDWNNKTGKVKFNENWAAMLGYKLEEINQNLNAWKKRIYEEDKERVLKKLNQHLQGDTSYYESEHRLRTKDNNWKWIKDIGRVVKRDEDGDPVRAVGIHLDIDDRKRAEQRAEYLSFHDELTGLYNRRYFESEKDRLNNSRRLPISIIVGDLDKLKEINDSYGHKKGDEYIKQAGKIFDDITREEDLVARIGGDEFAILLPEADSETAGKVCKRFYKKLQEINSNKQLPRKLSISLGSATMTSNNQDLDKVLEQADQNMYRNKKRRR